MRNAHCGCGSQADEYADEAMICLAKRSTAYHCVRSHTTESIGMLKCKEPTSPANLRQVGVDSTVLIEHCLLNGVQSRLYAIDSAAFGADSPRVSNAVFYNRMFCLAAQKSF